jgi:kynurenine 3-monooxygenase
VNVQECAVSYLLAEDDQPTVVKGSLLVGADGVHSTVREAISNLVHPRSESISLEWLHLTLSKKAFESRRLSASSIHVWPRGNILLHCIPNINGLGICTLIMPRDSAADGWSFTMLEDRSKEKCEQLCKELWPDLLAVEPTLVSQLQIARTCQFRQVSCERFHFSNRVVLIGDAAHAALPFFGQGMNMALEDAQMLSAALLYEGLSIAHKLHVFSALRVPDGLAVQALSREQYVHLTKGTPSYMHRLRQAWQRNLNRWLPWLFYPINYALVNFCDLSYSEVLAIVRQRERSFTIGCL